MEVQVLVSLLRIVCVLPLCLPVSNAEGSDAYREFDSSMPGVLNWRRECACLLSPYVRLGFTGSDVLLDIQQLTIRFMITSLNWLVPPTCVSPAPAL